MLLFRDRSRIGDDLAAVDLDDALVEVLDQGVLVGDHYQPAPQPAYQEEDLAYEDTSLYGVEGEEAPEENAGVLAQQILLEQMPLEDDNSEEVEQ